MLTDRDVGERVAAGRTDRSSSPPYRYSLWHHPRVFRLGSPGEWCWQCGCGSSSHAVPADGQRAAALAAIAHVHNRPGSR